MDDLRRSSFLSPVVLRGIRKPFGEMTNTPPNKRVHSDHTTPMQQQQQSSSTPNDDGAALTPMANLKLLMKVAAAADSRPSRRELFKDENDENQSNANTSDRLLVIDDHDYVSESIASSATLLSDSSSIQTPTSASSLSIASSSTPSSNSSNSSKVSRKDKSLGLLCDKFISRFPREVPPAERCEIPLDDLARQMSTERRRIYDIVNVLESVQMMTKVGKNLYQWHGITHQIMTLAWLRQLAQKLDMLQRYHDVKRLEAAEEDSMLYGGSPAAAASTTIGCSPRERDLKRSPQLTSATPTSINSSFSSCSSQSPSPSPIERKTSLGVACQKFLMLFLIAPEPNAKINLDFAARVIHGIGLPDAIMKTRIRRLYDIANILQSLKLIEKVQITEAHGGRKPAFQYMGPDIGGIEVNRDVLQTLPSTRQRHSLLTFGKNLLDMPDDPNDFSLASAGRKRLTPDSGFSSTVSLNTSSEKRQFITLERSRSCNDVALNLTKPRKGESEEFAFAVPRPALADFQLRQRAATTMPSSLMDLSAACETERNRFSPSVPHLLPQYPASRSLLQHQHQHLPYQPSQGVSLLKRALTSPAAPTPAAAEPLSLLKADEKPRQVMKLVGFNQRSKTVITLMSPPTANWASSRSSPPAGGAHATGGVSITKVPSGLYRAATL